VRGLPWCREGHRFIGKVNFTANILCRAHNSDLSPVDAAGAAAFAVIRETALIHDTRTAMLEKGVWAGRFDDIGHEIDGDGLERWLLKTLINMEVSAKQALPIGQNTAHGVDIELVEIAFGRRTFRGKAGLHWAGFQGEAVNMEERIQNVSWIRGDPPRYVAAGAFVFYGLRFFLCLEPSGFPDALEMNGNQLLLMRHVEQINVQISEKPSQHIKFRWF
jgi:hypothetical protein